MKQQTEAEETQSEAEEYFEIEQTKEVTKKRMFRLPCFEAEQTQREAEEHFETEQTKEVTKKRIVDYFFVSNGRSYIETVASFYEQERFVYIIYSLLKSSECIVCYCLLCECHVLYISLDGNSYVDTIKIC